MDLTTIEEETVSCSRYIFYKIWEMRFHSIQTAKLKTNDEIFRSMLIVSPLSMDAKNGAFSAHNDNEIGS